MNETIKQEWIKTLEGKQYPQCQSYLRTEDGFCCLGVLCEVMHIPAQKNGPDDESGRPVTWAYCTDVDKDDEMPPADVLDAAGLTLEQARYLSKLNDQGDKFHVIANYIRNNL